jgi:hypothetical protein
MFCVAHGEHSFLPIGVGKRKVAHLIRSETERLLVVVLCLAAAASRRLPLEHVFCDAESSQGTYQSAMMAKARCKGSGCPGLDGKKVRIEECRWPTVNDRELWVEETSGWYLFYEDEGRTIPFRPTTAELKTLNSGGEFGYLREHCGVLVF